MDARRAGRVVEDGLEGLLPDQSADFAKLFAASRANHLKAVEALLRYLRLKPDDADARAQLDKEYVAQEMFEREAKAKRLTDHL